MAEVWVKNSVLEDTFTRASSQCARVYLKNHILETINMSAVEERCPQLVQGLPSVTSQMFARHFRVTNREFPLHMHNGTAVLICVHMCVFWFNKECST